MREEEDSADRSTPEIAEVFDLMTKWIEKYRRQAEQRYARLDAVLTEMNNDSQSSGRTLRKGQAS